MAASIHALLTQGLTLAFSKFGDVVMPLVFNTIRPHDEDTFNETTGVVTTTPETQLSITAIPSPVQSYVDPVGHQIRQRKFLVRASDLGATVPLDGDWLTEADNTRWDIYAVERLGDSGYVLRGRR